ncbi:vWA domain-containing protein [Nonlabens xiamenensis]|uniref:vWA domain-containing protein n=1 Tax=Nonlabens xiamenensis TaxID=2341043 RepID=UPI000F613A7D|nr:VWA domain-containing protein [Nonlabens xiamenensis]
MKNFMIFIVICLTNLTMAQQTITGTVSDADGPLFGATVVVKGTKKATTTDYDGKYTIQASIEDSLIFSFSGYDSQEVLVGNQREINVQLTSSLDQVVITGYRTRTKAALKVSSETISSRPNRSVIQRLSGQTTGIQITTASGQPGANSSISVRGQASIRSNNSPLIVINGYIASRDDLSQINADKVSEVKILKDAAATAIYGNRGSNGVILVNTQGRKKLKKADKLLHQIKDLFHNESYKEIEENKFEQTYTAPLSTFSIDVDKASYANVRRMINQGQQVHPDAVKIEEMINYFTYDYDQPTDEHPFAVHTELTQTPWNEDTQLVKIGLQGKIYEEKDLPPSHLTFLIDVSGSMSSPNKLPLLQSAFHLLVQKLRPEDKVSIVVYAGAAGLVLEPTSGNNKQKILEALNSLKAGGSTAGGEGIELAYDIAQKHFIKEGNNRVILATDGDFNVGASSDNAMEEMIVEKRKTGVFLSVLGMGYGNYKDAKLEILADKGNGNHSYIDNMQEARKVFGQEYGGSLYTIAKDVKLQVEFNPKNVQAYRLIGYENRLLATEDFVDDTKDAGELGAGHTVTALYEIIPTGSQSEHLKALTNLKYTNTQFAHAFDDELFTVKLRYKKPDGDQSILLESIQENELTKAGTDMQFAAAVALFGMQLRRSDFSNGATLEDIVQLAKAGRGKDEDGYRAEFVRLVEAYAATTVNNMSYLQQN